VSASGDSTLKVWDLESGACLRTLEGYALPEGFALPVQSVSVTPDGRRVVAGSQDNTVRVWDLESGACLRTLEGHTNEVGSVSVTPDGRWAVSGSQDNTVRVWDLESGACILTLEGHTKEVTSVSVTQDGRRVVSASRDNTLRVWDLHGGLCLGLFVAAAPLNAVAVLSELLTIGTSAGQVVLVDMRNLPPEPSVTDIVPQDTTDAAYEALLRRGLDLSRAKGTDHEETLAHLAALAVHLGKVGKTVEARSVRDEHDLIYPRVEARREQEKEGLGAFDDVPF
jgi:WD40 repeat protein